MASDVGILKVGISAHPAVRLKAVAIEWPIIKRLHSGYGMSSRDARLVERMVHRKLAPFIHKNELFRVSETEAVQALDDAVRLFGINPIPLNVLDPPRRKVRTEYSPRKERADGFFTFRFDRTLREKAERIAKADKRALGVWVSLVIADKIAALDAERAASRPRKARDPVTSSPHPDR